MAMKHKITLRTFFFNAEKDYLPYYKNFTFRLDGETVLRDVLHLIAREHHEFAYPEARCWLRVNGLVVSGGKTVERIVERCGSEWTLEPLQERRARHALVIDDSDFERSFELLAPWADAGDRAYYESLYPLHYASETFRFTPDYIGDAVLLTARRMIERGHEAEEEILAALTEAECGLYCAEYENNLFDARDETAAIEALKQRVFRPRKTPLGKKLAGKLCRKAPGSYEGYGVEGGVFALYTGPGGAADRERFAEALAAKGGSLVDFERSDRLIGRSLIESNPELACRKAGTMLAAAYDSGARALIFAREVDLKYVRDNFAAIERAVSRELPIPVISHSEFAARFLGEEAETVPAAS
jgi:succinate dehydrogenase/fumarate reductase-like Fe-S protein